MPETTSAPFRSSSPAPSSSTPANSAPSGGQQHRIGTKDDDATPYIYEAVEKKPYAVKYLDLDLYNDDDSFKDVQEQAKQFDQYVIKQAKAQGLKDSHESYKEVVEAIYKQIGKSPNEDPVKALKRLSTAANAIERLNSAKLAPILSAKTLTPTEFEEVQPDA